MWEYVQIVSWIGMNALWVGVVAGVSSYVGYHFGYGRGYEDGEKAMNEAIEHVEQEQNRLRR